MSRRDWLLALALIAITFLVYAPAWNGQPIWDDDIHITKPALRSFDGLVRIWKDPAAAPQYYPVLHTLFAFGLLTKTAIVALPAILLIVFWWRRGAIKLQRDLLSLIPFFAIGLAAAVVTIWVEQKFCADHGETFNFSFLDRCLAAGRLVFFYLANIFWPAKLSLLYPRWKIDVTQWWQYLFPIGVAILFIAAW